MVAHGSSGDPNLSTAVRCSTNLLGRTDLLTLIANQYRERLARSLVSLLGRLAKRPGVQPTNATKHTREITLIIESNR